MSEQFRDRDPLSEIDDDITDTMELSEKPGRPSLHPVPDTGVKPLLVGTRETRSAKRRATEEGEPVESTSRRRKVRQTCDTEEVHNQLGEIKATLQEILKEIRSNTAAIDNLRTTVTNKMAAVDGKLAIQQERIHSLQTARRDGFLNSLTLDSRRTQPLEAIPHFVPPTAPTPAPSTSHAPLDQGIEDTLKALGF